MLTLGNPSLKGRMDKRKNILDIKFDVKVETTINGEDIHQIASTSDITGERYQKLSHYVYKTQDEQFREALIKLGWKPPEEKE